MNDQITWTPQQQSFFHRLRDTDDSLLLCAVAGSGKTTTLVEGARHLRGTILAVAFNVRIKKTLESKISSIATCKTLNGLGHGAMTRLLNRNVKIDAQKVRKIVRGLIKLKEYKDLWMHTGDATTLVARAKSHGLVPSKLRNSPPSKGIIPDEVTSWEKLASPTDAEIELVVCALSCVLGM